MFIYMYVSGKPSSVDIRQDKIHRRLKFFDIWQTVALPLAVLQAKCIYTPDAS